MSIKNKMINIISAIDENQNKEEIIKELSDPIFEIGFKPTVIRLLSQMKDLGLVKEEESSFIVTNKGKEFMEQSSIDEVDVIY